MFDLFYTPCKKESLGLALKVLLESQEKFNCGLVAERYKTLALSWLRPRHCGGLNPRKSRGSRFRFVLFLQPANTPQPTVYKRGAGIIVHAKK